MNKLLNLKKFKDIDFGNQFFETLDNDYPGFKNWVKSKAEKQAYYLEINGKINGFLYLKPEIERNQDIIPELPLKSRMKIGTFKVEAHGTSIGEAFFKQLFRVAYIKKKEHKFEEIYVTIFEKHEGLVNLFKKYGFKYHGFKLTNNEKESVYIKKLEYNEDESVYGNYPLIKISKNNKFLLTVNAKYHTLLFPNSMLNTEKNIKLEDVAHTNSIRKIYMCKMFGLTQLKEGDFGVIYRPKAYHEPGYTNHKSVVTSIVKVVNVLNMNDFKEKADYLKYCLKHSVFSLSDLENFWDTKKYPIILEMLYVTELNKRINLNNLRNNGINLDYWGFGRITDDQFKQILKLGEVNASFIID